ncbi:MAG: hypothetical protein NC307_08020 [Roseburia sp.]|nr:hypothetical protein [Roseburia sp.]
MKRYLCIGLVFLLAVSLFAGCGSRLNVDRSTVYVQKKGTIQSVDVIELDKAYYDEAELEEGIKSQVEEYCKEAGEKAFVEDFSVKDKIAKLNMKFTSFEDYQSLIQIELYCGNIVKAQAQGYDFDVPFYAFTDGEKNLVSTGNVLSEDDNKVVIIRANVDVKVDGTILYVSGENTTVTGKDTVSIAGDEERSEEAELTYIVYK